MKVQAKSAQLANWTEYKNKPRQDDTIGDADSEQRELKGEQTLHRHKQLQVAHMDLETKKSTRDKTSLGQGL